VQLSGQKIGLAQVPAVAAVPLGSVEVGWAVGADEAERLLIGVLVPTCTGDT
jgi:hypothetical protein